MIVISMFILIALLVCAAFFCVFFDQAVLTRRGTVFRVNTKQKNVALTFDDGPSPVWTPKILDELKECNVKATFFMIGHHVQKYPDVARRIVNEGHTIGNHGYAHSVMFYYTVAEIEEEIKYSEHVIQEVTGQKTIYFRPPKAWMKKDIKNKIKSMGYQIVLWSLNSKDWVCFNHKVMVRYLMSKIRCGDIILFHDSGNVMSIEGGVRNQTVKAISLLVRSLKEKGFNVVPLKELLEDG